MNKKTKNKPILEFRVSNLALIAGVVLCTALSIASSLLLGKFVDIISSKQSFDQEILFYLFGILGLMLLAAVASLCLAQYLPGRLTQNKCIQYSQDVMKGLLKISQKDYEARDKGYYINLVTTSAFTYGDIYGQINVELIGNALCVLLLLLIATGVSPYLGLVYAVYIPLFALLTQGPNKRVADYQKDGLMTQDTFLGGTKKIVEEKRAINIARAEDYYSSRYKRDSDKFLAFLRKFKWYTILTTNLPALMSTLLLVATMGIAAKLYFDGAATFGMFFVVFQLSQLLQTPLNRCFEILIYCSINEVHIERIQTFLALQNEKSEFEKVYGHHDDLVHVEQGQVFSSAEKKRLLFAVDDLTIPKKSFVVIKGGNGTGKSTLTNLLTGFTTLGLFTGDLQLDSSLSNAAYLSYPILFTTGDLKENMFGRPIDQKAYECLGISYANKEIHDSGNNLSYGEQQKLALLRVLSSDAEVIVLDEPFTNLDRNTIQRLTEYLASIKGQKAVFAIMHSPELDTVADVVLEIGNERICARSNISL